MKPEGSSAGDCHLTPPPQGFAPKYVFEASEFKSFVPHGVSIKKNGEPARQYKADWKIQHPNSPSTTESITILFDVVEGNGASGERAVNFLEASSSGVSEQLLFSIITI